MKKLLVTFILLALLVAVGGNANAQGKLALSVGADVLLPMGTFGDAFSTGFGGSVRGQYHITPMFSAGLTVGYYVWSGKDISGITLPNFKGVPARAFGKYYFMPEGEKVRAYGIGELGVFFASVGEKKYTIGTTTYTSPSATETDFNYAPGVGAEFALGGGKTMIDVSVRYDGIATTGSTSGSFAGRVAVLFPLGN